MRGLVIFHISLYFIRKSRETAFSLQKFTRVIICLMIECFKFFFQCIPFQHMSELNDLLSNMIEHFNSVEDKVVFFVVTYIAF